MREMTDDQMREQLEAGEAEALLPEGVPGPVFYDGRWWITPQGQNTYREADTDTEDKLYDMAIRLSAGTRTVREATGETS